MIKTGIDNYEDEHSEWYEGSQTLWPGYGFPNGIVTFDHYFVSVYKRGKYVKNLDVLITN